MLIFFFSSRRRHTRCYRDWSSDVCSSDLLAHAVHAAHLAGILHRDLKPANILLADVVENDSTRSTVTLPWVPKITDFGLAKKMRSEERRVGKECGDGRGAYAGRTSERQRL